jgi:hypothetical protein
MQLRRFAVTTIVSGFVDSHTEGNFKDDKGKDVDHRSITIKTMGATVKVKPTREQYAALKNTLVTGEEISVSCDGVAKTFDGVISVSKLLSVVGADGRNRLEGQTELPGTLPMNAPPAAARPRAAA